MGKRKYNRGHYVDGVWCIAGIERTKSKQSFVIPVEARNAEILNYVITNT